jgi:peptidoglycan hydrolase CwlO-like protein
MKRYGKKLLFLLLAPILLLSIINVARVRACSNEQECSDLIKQYTDQISKLQGQASTLKNQIAQFDAQIKLTTLKIADTQNKIAQLGGRIDQLEVSLNDLTTAFSSRAVETYKLSKFENNFSFIMSASDINDAVTRFHYLEKIQEADRSLLEKLQEAQTTYIGEKQSQETLQGELKKQQANLNSQKAAKNSLLTATKNDESKYQSLLSQARAQLAAFRSFVASQGGASILSNQTKCGSWGCYYNQRDGQWGNMEMGISGVSMADAGCLVTSVAMVAKHYGKNIKPSDLASNVAVFYANTAYMNDSWSAAGISVSRSKYSVSSGKIDSELAAGRPVIVGLYGTFNAPQHFIVIKSKDGDKYIMEDPFMENGGGDSGDGRPLTDKYSFSDIVRVDVVTVN